MPPSFLCSFELHTKEPRVVMEALRADDQDSAETIEYSVRDDMLVVEIKSDGFRPFMKTAFFFMERFKLSSDTIALCEGGQKGAGDGDKPVC